jgi:NAD(P)-dependent dehydrogenase (short-subunit alcohol dehydrogenase family)
MKLAAVVGVGKGIGGSVARALAANGYHVGLFARNETYSKADKLTSLANEINSLGGGRAYPVQMDASSAQDVARGFESLSALAGGRNVSVLVYNAGARNMGQVTLEEQVCKRGLAENCFV